MAAYARQFAIPLALVGLLAGILGFFVMRTVQGTTDDARAQVSVVGIKASPTPSASASPSPSPGGGGGGSGGGSRRDPRCPSGCECQFPQGGTVVVCRGSGSVKIP